MQGVTKRFGLNTLFEGLTFDVQKGQLLVVTGPSGSGKTTLLRMIAGLIPFEGAIKVGDRSVISGTPTPELVLIPQQPSLWEHLSALDNVALVRRLLFKETISEARKQASRYLEMLDVMHAADRFPRRLSGGEQQRIALARGLATERDIFLLDEITANIDHKRKQLIGQVVADLKDRGKTVIFVTHDPAIIEILQMKPYCLEPDGLHPDGVIVEEEE